MRIRRALVEDVPAIRTVQARAYDLYEVLLGYVPAPALEEPGMWIAAGQAWVGERDSTVMAVLVARQGDGKLVILSAVVDPDWQGEGHGRALLDHAEALAREAGLAALHLSTNVLMARNISLYQHCGYRVAGRRPHPSQPGHELADMHKAI